MLEATVTIIEPNITREESDRNFEKVKEVMQIIANQLAEKQMINEAL